MSAVSKLCRATNWNSRSRRAVGSVGSVPEPQQFPIVDAIANKIVQEYQSSTCEQLWQEKAQAKNKPKSPQEQEAISILHNDSQMRAEFINKIAKEHKLLLAFDALVLSEALGREVRIGKIVHGDDDDVLKVETALLADEVRKCSKRIAALVSGEPPDLVLNRHCSQCEFQTRLPLSDSETTAGESFSDG